MNQGAHEQLGIFDRMSSVGVFRHEDESWNAYFQHFAALYPGRYRIRASFWSFQWDKGQVLPSRGTEAARLSVVQFNENGRGGQHPSYVLGYYDAPSLESKVHEMDVWLNMKETLGFNVASLAPVVLYCVGTWGQSRTMGFTGPCIANDWVEIEGPFNDVWPPRSHKLLYGELPHHRVRACRTQGCPPASSQAAQTGNHRHEKQTGTRERHLDREAAQPLADADRLLASFLPKAFRRPVDAEVRKQYVAKVEERLKAGDCFETAMRWAYRAALCSPDFLYLVEPPGRSMPSRSLHASRISSGTPMPDDALIALASSGKLHDAKVLDEQVERLLKDAKSQRFIEDFLGQWLKLRADRRERSRQKTLPRVQPVFAGLDGRRDARLLPRTHRAQPRCRLPRAVRLRDAQRKARGALRHPRRERFRDPPRDAAEGLPARRFPHAGRDLESHGQRHHDLARACAARLSWRACSANRPSRSRRISPPSSRTCTARRRSASNSTNIAPMPRAHRATRRSIRPASRWNRSMSSADSAIATAASAKAIPRRGVSIDPRISISFKLGRSVDASGQLPDDRKFTGIADFKTLLATDKHILLHNLAKQLTVYATGRDIAFSDRAALNDIVARTEQQGGGIRTLLHEIVLNSLFQTR